MNFRVFQDKIEESLRKLLFRILDLQLFPFIGHQMDVLGCTLHIHVHGMCKFIVEKNIVILSLLNIATIT